MHRFQQFLIGRNGPDALAKANSILACLLLILSMFLHGIPGTVLWVLALVFLCVSYYRMFSRDLVHRQAENQKFLQLIAPVTRKLSYLRLRRKQRNIYSFFKCPACGTVLRVPKGKGHIRVTCKNCSHVFERNS